LTTVLRFECRICRKDAAVTYYVQPPKTNRDLCGGCWLAYTCPPRSLKRELGRLVKALRADPEDAELYNRAAYLRRRIKLERAA